MRLLNLFLALSLSSNVFASNHLFHDNAISIEEPKTVRTEKDTNYDKKIDYVCVSIYHFNTLRNVIAEDTNYDGRYDRFIDELNGIDCYERFISEDNDYDGYIDQMTNRFRQFGKGLLVRHKDKLYDLFLNNWIVSEETPSSRKTYTISKDEADYLIDRKEYIEAIIEKITELVHR